MPWILPRTACASCGRTNPPPFTVLSPCGVCQERLRYWGEDVRVGVTTDDGSLRFVPLRELQPYHWTRAYPPETLDHYGEPNE